MSAESKIRSSDEILAELQAFNVGRIKDGAEQTSPAELSALIAGSGLASRRMSSALAASRKGQKDAVETAVTEALKVAAANDNDIDADPEMEMDDDTGRTPERVEQVRAELERRLGLACRAGEFKSLDGGGALDADRALRPDAQDAGAPPAPTA